MLTFDDLPLDIVWLILRQSLLYYFKGYYLSLFENGDQDLFERLENSSYFMKNMSCGNLIWFSCQEQAQESDVYCYVKRRFYLKEGFGSQRVHSQLQFNSMATFDDLPDDVVWLILRQVVLEFITSCYASDKLSILSGDYSSIEGPVNSRPGGGAFSWFGSCAWRVNWLSQTSRTFRTILRKKTIFVTSGFRFQVGSFSNPI